MRPLKNLGTLIIAGSVSCLLLAAAPVVRPQDKATPKDKLKELHKERVVAAQKIHDLTIKGYTQGDAKFTIDQVHAAKAKLLEARLELSETNRQRIQVHQDAVKDAAKWEQAGPASQVDQLKARLYRLEREIALTAFVVAATEGFPAIVTRFDFEHGTVSFLKLTTDGSGAQKRSLVVSADCKFVKVKFNKEKNKDEPEGELKGGKLAFANLVMETVEAERKETERNKFKFGLGGVYCELVTEGDNPPRVTEIRVFSTTKKSDSK